MEPVKMPEDIHLTVILSTEPKSRNLVTMFDEIAAIRAIKVHRDKLNTIPEKWKTGCGFYILVSDISNGRFQAYVGKATQDNLADRVASHRREKENWTYAFLFQRDTSNGLTSTQASYVEGAVYRKLKECSWISVINNQIAGDKTLALHEMFYMRQVVDSVDRILNIFGYSMEEGPVEEIIIANKVIEETIYIEEFPKVIELDSALVSKNIRQNEIPDFKTGRSNIASLVDEGKLLFGEEVIFNYGDITAKGSIGSKGIIFNDKEYTPSGARAAALIANGNKPSSFSGWIYWSVLREDKLISLEDIRDGHTFIDKIKNDLPIGEIYKDLKSSSSDMVEVPKGLPPKKESSGNKHYGVNVETLIEAGILQVGEKLTFLSKTAPAKAILGNKGIIFNGIESTPSKSGRDALRYYERFSKSCNGWAQWAVMRDGKWISLEKCRNQYLAYQEANS